MSNKLKVMFRKALRQTVVYWGNPANDGYGNYTYDAPVEIKCRWQNKQELFIDPEGREQRSRAVVYVDQDLDLEGFLMLGTLDDLDSTGEVPADVELAFRIRALGDSPDFRNRRKVRKLWV